MKTMEPTDEQTEKKAVGSETLYASLEEKPKVAAHNVVIENPELEANKLNLFYGDFHAVKDIDLDIARNKITALIGPSGCGKSTVLRCFNRMNDLISSARVEGEVLLNGIDIYQKGIDPVAIRRKVGMVFQKPNPFPKTIYENISWGARINGFKGDMDELVEKSLREAALWDEVKDKLDQSALALSGGQQQRLCIARAVAVQPEVLLMDEPCSALDPIATVKIKDLMLKLKENYTIAVVTHNMQKASRVSDYTSFFYMGDLIEFGETEQVFTKPVQKQTEDYITGRFG